MFHFLPAPLLGIFSLTLIVLNTIFWCIPIYLFTLLKFIPIPAWQRVCTRANIWFAEGWISGNSAMMWLTQRTTWRVSGDDGLRPDAWYLVISNHLSSVDIVVLQHIFNRRIPFLKFFIKQELIWVPLLGMAWWGLDFPFMKRYSQQKLAKHPELRGKDLETTRRAMEKFKTTPTSIMNFLEGTRFTPEKKDKQQSPYTHLLKPKAGGVAYTLATMGEQLDAILDVTIAYPAGIPSTWNFLQGRIPEIRVDVVKRPLPDHLRHGDYSHDPDYRAAFQAWVSDLWAEKDMKMAELLEQPALEATWLH